MSKTGSFAKANIAILLAQDLGGYNDFSMAGETCVSSVNGLRLICINVEDVDQSAATCVELGGNVLAEPRNMGDGWFCVIQDPAGAMCALYESAKQN